MYTRHRIGGGAPGVSEMVEWRRMPADVCCASVASTEVECEVMVVEVDDVGWKGVNWILYPLISRMSRYSRT